MLLLPLTQLLSRFSDKESGSNDDSDDLLVSSKSLKNNGSRARMKPFHGNSNGHRRFDCFAENLLVGLRLSTTETNRILQRIVVCPKSRIFGHWSFLMMILGIYLLVVTSKLFQPQP